MTIPRSRSTKRHQAKQSTSSNEIPSNSNPKKKFLSRTNLTTEEILNTPTYSDSESSDIGQHNTRVQDKDLLSHIAKLFYDQTKTLELSMDQKIKLLNEKLDNHISSINTHMDKHDLDMQQMKTELAGLPLLGENSQRWN